LLMVWMSTAVARAWIHILSASHNADSELSGNAEELDERLGMPQDVQAQGVLGGGAHPRVQAGYGPGTVWLELTGSAPGGSEMEGEAGCQTLSASASCRNFPLRHGLHCVLTVGEHQRYD
jgi:hypothetical protein